MRRIDELITISSLRNEDGNGEGKYRKRVLSRQGGDIVVEYIDSAFIIKAGKRVRIAELRAMQLVRGLKDIEALVPEPFPDMFYNSGGGRIIMTIIPGTCLTKTWDCLDNLAKISICTQVWAFISRIRTIPKPAEFGHLYQCSADGTPSRDHLLDQGDNSDLHDDHELRERIYRNYLKCAGTRYEKELPYMLPRSERSVFTHGDLAPRNIMVEGTQVTGILDWENAGWYPEYWEYANCMSGACYQGDWQDYMEKLAPETWDLEGIEAARRVVF